MSAHLKDRRPCIQIKADQRRNRISRKSKHRTVSEGAELERSARSLRNPVKELAHPEFIQCVLHVVELADRYAAGRKYDVECHRFSKASSNFIPVIARDLED